MSKVLHNRVFRFLVCFLLIGCILVNLSPLKAEATAVVVPAAVLTFEGLMAALYSMGIGIVATALTVEAWNNIGNSLTDYITDTGDTTITEVWIDLEAMYDSYIPGGGLDPDDELKWAEKLKTVLSRGLLGAIAGWLCTLVNMGGYEIEEEAATGYAYYNGILLPQHGLPINNSYPCVFIHTDGTYYYAVQVKSNYKYPAVYNYDSYYLYGVGTTCLVTQMTSESIVKSYNATISADAYDSRQGYKIIWSNVDIPYVFGGLFLAGSEPVSVGTTTIEPIYVGDIPQQIQDGEKDKDNLVLPIIDPFRFIQTPSTALDDVNQMQQALKDGTTTLDQYLEQVTYQEPTTDPDPTTDPSESTQPSTGTDTEWQPPQDPGAFALDLSNVFPFCIPFDLYDFLTCLNADPVAPVIQWELALPGGGSFPIELDLSPFDPVAQLLRRLQLLLFCVALAIKTRDLIKG